MTRLSLCSNDPLFDGHKLPFGRAKSQERNASILLRRKALSDLPAFNDNEFYVSKIRHSPPALSRYENQGIVCRFDALFQMPYLDGVALRSMNRGSAVQVFSWSGVHQGLATSTEHQCFEDPSTLQNKTFLEPKDGI